MAVTGQTKAVVGGTLIDGSGESPLENSTILIKKSEIIAVGKRNDIAIPSGTTVIDAGGKTVMPGMIDTHVHLGGLFFECPPEEKSVVLASLKATPALKMLYGAKHAKAALEAGFTSLRNLDNWDFVALRQGIQRGLVPGPRLVVSGWVNMTGGHLDLCAAPPFMPRMPGDTADGVWQIRKLVRELVCYKGVNLIKTSATGGQGGEGEQPWWRNYTVEELKAITDEAHALGRKVAAHCSGSDGIRNAVEASVDSLEHCVHMDDLKTKDFDDTVRIMMEKRLFYVPTLSVGHGNVQSHPEDGVPEYLIEKSKRDLPHMIESFKRLHAAGVRIAMGTDTVGHMPWLKHGDYAIELEWMVKHGMSPMEAIVCSTRNASECLGIGTETGTISAGKAADLLVLDGDPLRDITILKEREKLHLVMKEGNIVSELK